MDVRHCVISNMHSTKLLKCKMFLGKDRQIVVSSTRVSVHTKYLGVHTKESLLF